MLIKNRANSFDNTSGRGDNLHSFPDANLGWSGYTPTTFSRNLVVTYPTNGVLSTPTAVFTGQACARKPNDSPPFDSCKQRLSADGPGRSHESPLPARRSRGAV